MWIDSIEIKGFGCLVNRHYEFPRDKVVLIIDENEQGKSTLVAAILASLCGLPTRRSSKNAVRPIDVYKPWFGESYCVKLHFEATGLRYCVERDFDRNTFVVRDVYTNVDVSGSFPVDLASHFLRLPRDDYERIAVISGKEVSRFDSSPTIRERLTAVVEGSENSVGAEVALDRLRSAVYRLEGADIKPDTAIRRIQEQIDQRERRLHELDKKLEEADENVQLLYKLRKRRKELEERVSELNSEYGLSRLSEISERIAVAEQDRQKHSELLEELKSLEHYATFPVERRDQLYKAVARLQQFEDQIRDCEARERQLNAEADKIERQLNSYKSLAGASQDDLIRIRSTAESLSQARTSLDEARERFESVKRDWLSRLGKALVLLGSLSVLLSLVGLSVKAINLSPGMAVVAIGLAVIVAGLVLYLRRASVQTEVRAHLKQSERAFEQMAELAILHLRRLGVEADEQSDLVFVLNEIIDRLETYLKYSANLEDVRSATSSVVEEKERLIKRKEEEISIVRSILHDCGLDGVEPLEQALHEFKIGCERSGRYRQIKELELPNLEARLLDESELSRLYEEERELLEWVGIQTMPNSCRQPSEIDRERQMVSEELLQIGEQISAVERRIGGVVENYRNNYLALREELEKLRSELRRAERFKDALSLAGEVLSEVALEFRRRWADVLNERASSILPHLNPDYNDLRFDESLNFTIHHVKSDRVIQKLGVDACLSTGAKDQIYLSVRLACCLALSAAGESVPMILDDVFIYFDDDRFKQGLRYVVEDLPKDQQVIMLTCHRARHQHFEQEEWFREHVHLVGMD